MFLEDQMAAPDLAPQPLALPLALLDEEAERRPLYPAGRVVQGLRGLAAHDEVCHGLLHRIFRFLNRCTEEDQDPDLLLVLGCRTPQAAQASWRARPRPGLRLPAPRTPLSPGPPSPAALFSPGGGLRGSRPSGAARTRP